MKIYRLMKVHTHIFVRLIFVFVFTLIYASFLAKALPINAAASPGYFKCVWTVSLSGTPICDIDFSNGNVQCDSTKGESVDGSKCHAYTTQSTCNNAPEIACLTNAPTYQPTGANCANRKGECPNATYPNCVDDVTSATCSSGGSNYCSIPHYTPMGNTSPYNLVSCASKSGPSTPSGSIGSPSNCPVCQNGWVWSYTQQQCQRFVNSKSEYKDPTIVDCTSTTNTCYAGTGCTSFGSSTDISKCDNGKAGIQTAIGCIPVFDQTSFLSAVLTWAVGIGGGIAFLLIIYAGFMIMTSSGNPERLKAGQELLTSAISGLILLVFSVFVLKFIGIDILGLGAFGFGTPPPTP